jgi:uncharacterized protein (TIGR02599 family)
MKRGNFFARRRNGFTLVELLVATAIMLIVMVVLLQVITSMTSLWHNSSGRLSGFQAARSAFATLNRDLSRATLKTYIDYVNATDSPRTAANANAFIPTNFARASELHFICGPAVTLFPAANGATKAENPGDAVFFQAPLGVTQTAADKYLTRALKTVGFYVQYGDLDNSIFPTWLSSLFGGETATPNFRLMEYVQPTETMNAAAPAESIYNVTSTGIYSLNWLPNTVPDLTTAQVSAGSTVLAEDVLLLILRPRLDPEDEQAVITAPLAAPTSPSTLGAMGVTYTTTGSNPTAHSIISPAYNYDSRAWEGGSTLVPAAAAAPTPYAALQRNQLPPIIDVIMVCADPNSLVRLKLGIPGTAASSGTPPSAPTYLYPASTAFTHSDDTDMENDLTTFTNQLVANQIRYRVFRSSIQMQAAAWANE